MTNKTHTAAAVAGTAIYINLSGRTLSDMDEIVILLSASMAAVLPDIDNPKSKYGRTFILILWPLYVIQFITKRILPKIHKVVMHKGILHWPLFWIVVSVIGEFALPEYRIIRGIEIGTSTHLLCDYLTEGIYLLAPFKKRKYRCIIHCRTGGFVEEIIFYILIIAIYMMAKK